MKKEKRPGRLGIIRGMTELLIGGCLIALAVNFSAAARWIFGVALALCGAVRCGMAVLFGLMRTAYPQIRVTEDSLLSMAGSFGGGVYDLAKAVALFAGSCGAARLMMLLSGTVVLATGIVVFARSRKSGGRKCTVPGAYWLSGGAVLIAAALGENLGSVQMLGTLFAAGGLLALVISARRINPTERATISV